MRAGARRTSKTAARPGARWFFRYSRPPYSPCRFRPTPFVVIETQTGDTAMRLPSRSIDLLRSMAAVLAVGAAIAPPMRAQVPVKRTAPGAWGGKTNGAGHYADVNGIKLYYETRGSGKPLVLLHGGLGAIEMFGPNLPALAKGRQLIAVDLQGHGRTADIDRPLSVELMADDIAALIKYLKLDGADLMGYSLGGGVALQTAIRHPEVVRKLVIASAPFKQNGWYPEVLAGMASMDAEAMVGSPMHDAYVRAAPRPEDWPRFIAKFRQLLTREAYDWAQDVVAIKAPTLIVVGDADSVRLAHAVELFG